MESINTTNCVNGQTYILAIISQRSNGFTELPKANQQIGTKQSVKSIQILLSPVIFAHAKKYPYPGYICCCG